MTKVNLTFIMVTFGNYMSNKKSNGFKNRAFIIIKLHFTGKNVLPIKSECYFYILNACFDAEKKVFFLSCLRRPFPGYSDLFVPHILHPHLPLKTRDHPHLSQILEIPSLKRLHIRSPPPFWVGPLPSVEL